MLQSMGGVRELQEQAAYQALSTPTNVEMMNNMQDEAEDQDMEQDDGGQ